MLHHGAQGGAGPRGVPVWGSEWRLSPEHSSFPPSPSPLLHAAWALMPKLGRSSEDPAHQGKHLAGAAQIGAQRALHHCLSCSCRSTLSFTLEAGRDSSSHRKQMIVYTLGQEGLASDPVLF